MPSYFYTGKSTDGTTVTGKASARDESALVARLVSEGIFVDSCRADHGKLKLSLTRFLKRSEITRMTRQASVLLKSGISVLEALELVKEQAGDQTLISVMDAVIGQVESGKSVADALRAYPTLFDPLYTSMVDAGELSGELDSAFDRIATYREKYETTARKVKSAVAYPFLVVVVAIVVALALILYVVPIFSSMYENFGAELPSLTRTVVAFSAFLRGSIWYWLAVILAAGATIVYGATSERVRIAMHKLMVGLPLVKNLTVKMISARFCRTMGALLSSGVDIIYALQISSRTTGNHFVNAALQSAETLLAEGKTFTEALSSSFAFPKAMLRLTASGEKTGRLGEMLERAADYYERETEMEIGTLTSLIEPVIILVLGVFVAFILIAMYLPLFELVGSI